jgi:hypothetical protein
LIPTVTGISGSGQVSVTASATGGAGGTGYSGAKGGNGAAESLLNVVSGSTTGALSLTQSAYGGGGGGTGGGTPSGAAGAGGAASSSLTVADTKAAGGLSAYVTANGGAGGGTDTGAVGAGGAATATLTAASTKAASVSGQTSARGGDSGYKSGTGSYAGVGGAASATTNVTGNGGPAASGYATANATGGQGATAGTATALATVAKAKFGSASATSTAHNGPVWSASTTATAPVDGATTASTTTSFTSTQAPLIAIAGNEAASVVTLAPSAPLGIFATGAMSAATAGGAASLEYTDSAAINFSLPKAETVTLDLLGSNVLGAGFNSLTFTVSAPGFSLSKNFTTLAGAEAFFTSDKLSLGSFAAGSQYVDISYALFASGAARGFGFNFNIDPPSGGTVPEPSTWAMMLLGFAGLGYAAFRRARKTGRALIPE